MTLKPQDVMVLLKLIAIKQKDLSYNGLAVELCMSPSAVHAAAKRALAAFGASPLAESIVPSAEPLPVWPDPEGVS